MAEAHNLEPKSVDEAKVALAHTRDRMSDTLDAIESHLIAKKAELREKLNVLRPVKAQVRAHPWRAVGLAFGIGALIALSARSKDRNTLRLSARERDQNGRSSSS